MTTSPSDALVDTVLLKVRASALSQMARELEVECEEDALVAVGLLSQIKRCQRQVIGDSQLDHLIRTLLGYSGFLVEKKIHKAVIG